MKRFHAIRLIPPNVLVIFIILACSFGATTSNPAAGSQPSLTPISSGAAPDLTERPQIWFSPLDPAPPNQDRPFSGPSDFFDLFVADAPWQGAAEGTHVFKLYGGWLDRTATAAELRQIVADLQRRGMGIAFEGGPLTPTAECTGVIEGFAGPREGGNAAYKIKQAGGTVDYVDLEHPYDAVTFSDAPRACRYSAERAAQDVALYVQKIRSYFPNVRFGADETADHDLEHIARWVEAYRTVVGEDLAYFNFDLNYYRPSWAQEARAIEDYLHGQGIEFGMFYRGDENAATDAEWVAKAEQRFIEYEVIAGGRPDRAVFQSWHPHPQRVLPESDPTVFTYLINRYLRTRTALTLEAQAPSSNGQTFSGILTDEHGSPRPNAQVELKMTPLEGAGVVYDYMLSGTVPVGAIQADVGYRVNTECDCSGASEFTLYEVRYTENAGDSNLVPNGDFASGLQGWGPWGVAASALTASDLGSGLAMHVNAQPGQDAAINSARFATTSGAPFTVTFEARVSPLSRGSGYFDVIFLDASQELRRFRIPLEAATVTLGQAVTDQAGGFEIRVNETPTSPTSSTSFQGWYPGDDRYWPAYAEMIAAGQ